MNGGLPGWFVASGLRVTVKQPDSRGMPGFFAAIFSVVTQLDVCPVGPQNLRTEFLGRTTGCYSLSHGGPGQVGFAIEILVRTSRVTRMSPDRVAFFRAFYVEADRV